MSLGLILGDLTYLTAVVLGLALVAACAKLHGGRLVLGDNRPGLMAALELADPRS